MIYLGTSGFKYDDWKGTFYPKGVKEKEWLPYYARHFNALEIDSTYYRLMHPAVFYHMAQKVPETFHFAVKTYRTLTHEIGPSSRDDLTAFLQSIRPLQEAGKFGCILAQFPNSFHRDPKSLAYLTELRQRFGELPLAVEFRHKGWANEEVFQFFREQKIAFVCVDEPQFPTLMPPVATVTADFAYLRFHGRNYQTWWKSGEAKLRYDYRYSTLELEEWLPRIKVLSGQAGRLYIFMNNHFRGQAPANAMELQVMLESQLGASFPRATSGPAVQTFLPLDPER